MIYNVKTVKEYMESIPRDRIEPINKLRDIIKNNLPKGFEEEINYGMIGYVVPLSIYPKGYLNNKNNPLPFISIASQKNSINFYHMGIYANKELSELFVNSYQDAFNKKLDMGKSCFRFKKAEDIPYKLIGEISKKMSVHDIIEMYEKR